MKHAASVRPEPGSNSPLSEKLCPLCASLHTLELQFCPYHFCEINKFFVFSYSVVKVQIHFHLESIKFLCCYLYFSLGFICVDNLITLFIKISSDCDSVRLSTQEVFLSTLPILLRQFLLSTFLLFAIYISLHLP